MSELKEMYDSPPSYLDRYLDSLDNDNIERTSIQNHVTPEDLKNGLGNKPLSLDDDECAKKKKPDDLIKEKEKDKKDLHTNVVESFNDSVPV